jgi:alkylation response protein AidB-like acyl-CoA dehydrogenase
MSATTATPKAALGGEFLIGSAEAQSVFIPEDFTEEQVMIAKTCEDFLATEVLDKLDRLDNHKEPDLLPSLMDKAGELGLLGTSVPAEYGGFGMDFNTSMLVAEKIGAGYSFAVALSAHTGIGTLPIVYYGNDAQKAKYLPKLASGAYKASYCLTEPDSGSDANSGKTKAVLSADGKTYHITGQKMWITNGGFADIFIVFAKIENDKNLTAFLVEKTFGGITMNPEEEKMGIKGSSTRQIFFTDCPVPAENMLSERGNGFKIAVNILNIGRIKLGVGAVGGSKSTSTLSIKYANERKQFGVSIGTFGAIKYKLAEQAVRIFAAETACYRAGQDIDNAINGLMASGMPEAEAKLKGVEQFAIECAITKVHGSEVLDYVTDEGVQIFGGMGYSADAPMDRAYRDSRINRIFEGTNEINRLLAVGTVLKRAMKGELDIMGPAMAVAKEIMSIPDFGAEMADVPFAAEKKVLANLKKATLMIAGAAVQKFMQKFDEQQEIIMNLADMMIEIYVAESTLLRVERLQATRGVAATALYEDVARIYLQHAVDLSTVAARSAVMSFAEGDELRMMLLGVKRFTKMEPFNAKDARRRVADYLLAENKYAL